MNGPPHQRGEGSPNRRLRKDLKVLAKFVTVYCRAKHSTAHKEPVVLKSHEVERICGRSVELCDSCRRLLGHAFVMRARCPLDPKPTCRKCPTHCYAPKYRAQIREVMKYSGRRLVLRGRLDYLWHMFS